MLIAETQFSSLNKEHTSYRKTKMPLLAGAFQFIYPKINYLLKQLSDHQQQIQPMLLIAALY